MDQQSKEDAAKVALTAAAVAARVTPWGVVWGAVAGGAQAAASYRYVATAVATASTAAVSLLAAPAAPLVGVGVVGLVGGAAAIVAYRKYFEKPPVVPPRSLIDVAVARGMTPQALVAEVQLSIGVDAQHHYNFAFCGGAGTGKSSVVNALRGVADPPRHSPELGGEAPAPVGIGETTTRSLRYDYPAAVGLPFLKLWDMPGGGLVGHPSATYFMDMRLYAFDALFILADARIVEVATHVIQAALEHHVPVAFVYTKADLAVAALKRPGVIPNATDDAIIAAVRKDKKADFDKMVASAFPGAGIKMFIISSHNMADNACKFDELTFAAFAARANSQRQVAPDTLPAAGSGAGAVPL